MLKLHVPLNITSEKKAATFGWLCVETPGDGASPSCAMQPPSGGCVLKLLFLLDCCVMNSAATFGWLCVETGYWLQQADDMTAATFGWLCVETSRASVPRYNNPAATFGWLCVETIGAFHPRELIFGSHLRVAVC